jgi:GAF domain-containing protein
MKLQMRLLLLIGSLFTLSVLNYVLSYNPKSRFDEFFALGLLAVVALVYVFLRMNVMIPLKKLLIVRKDVAQVSGINMEFDAHDFSETTKVLNGLAKQIETAADVIDKLKTRNLDQDLSLLEGFKDNKLLTALDALRIDLKTLEAEDKERKWVAEGMARFVDILRQDHQGEKQFYDRLISNIVRYMGANQGGFFRVTEESENDKYLELVSCYAYDRQKHLNKRIEIGQGLIGQVYLEGGTMSLREVPDQYISITSGLGHATPNHLLIVPLKVNSVVECVIEIASFAPFMKFQIQFLEKLGESIASAVSNMRVNENTKLLLKEMQMHTEQLRAQEEEMRQSMEELEATQEEMARKERELSRLLEQSTAQQAELKNTVAEIERLKEETQREAKKMLNYQEMYRQDIIEILNQMPAKIFLKDSKGYMVLCNKTVADGYNLAVDKLIGTHDFDHFDPEQVKIWEAQEQEIMREGKKTFVQEERFHDNIKYLKTTKMPFYIHHLDQRGIMGFQFDVTNTLGAERIEKELRDEIARLRKSREAFA